MSAREASERLAAWIEADVEDAQMFATAERPSFQRQILDELIRRLTNNESQEPEAIKLLSIAQALLSGSYHYLDQAEAARKLEEVLRFSVGEKSTLVREQAFTVVSLFLNRIRDLQLLSESTLGEVDKAFDQGGSPLEKSVLSAMRNRIEAGIRRSRETRSQSARKFNVDFLDVPKAAGNVLEDAQADWYQDPWGWPEVEWLRSEPDDVVQRLQTDVAGWTVPIDVTKEQGGIRPGIVINPLDRVAFQSLVDELSVEAAAHLPPWVCGFRLNRTRRSKGAYEPNKSEWRIFSRRLAAFLKRFRFTAHLDVDSFFPSVDTAGLISQLGRRYRNAPVLDRLETYLNAWHRRPNGKGIPQRSLASSILSHAVLRPVDTLIDRLTEGGESRSFSASRWMDDIWLHSDNEANLRACVAEIQSLLEELRLSLNSEKSAVFGRNDANKFVRLVDTYAEEEQIDPNLILSNLLELKDVPAFHFGFEVSKILERNDFDSLPTISSGGFRQLNYVAQRLAKLFRASGEWKKFTDIYLELAQSHISADNLSVASWAEMFPNSPDEGVKKIQEFFAANVVDNLQRVLCPVAAQRVVAWSTNFGIGRIADVDFVKLFEEKGDVFCLRGITFAALRIGRLREKVTAAIDATDDVMLNRFLRATEYRPPALSARFASQ